MARPIRWLVTVAIVATTVTLVVLAVLRPDRPDRSLDRVRQAGVLTIGVDPSYPPFESIGDEGKLDGFDVDLGRAIAERLGVGSSLVTIDFGGIFDALEVGKVDVIIGGVTPDSDQSSRFGFTRPYYDAGLVVLIGAADRGNALGFESGSDADLNHERLSKDLATFELESFDDQDRLLAALEVGSLRGAVVDAVTASRWRRDLPGVTVLPRRMTSEPFVVASRNGDQALLRAVDQALKSLQDDGSLLVFERKWLG
jgi:ABC-type amino acid transport substrate-binding protein